MNDYYLVTEHANIVSDSRLFSTLEKANEYIKVFGGYVSKLELDSLSKEENKILEYKSNKLDLYFISLDISNLLELDEVFVLTADKSSKFYSSWFSDDSYQKDSGDKKIIYCRVWSKSLEEAKEEAISYIRTNKLLF